MVVVKSGAQMSIAPQNDAAATAAAVSIMWWPTAALCPKHDTAAMVWRHILVYMRNKLTILACFVLFVG